MFKFSLRLCIWLVLLVGSVLGLALDRKPWVRESKNYTEKEIVAVWPGMFSEPFFLKPYSPDETRGADNYPSRNSVTVIMDSNFQSLCSIARSVHEKILFLDDETMVAIDYSNPAVESYSVLHRRFPEWWWGIFYRPLFWIAVIVFFGTCIEFVSMRKRLRTG